MSISKFAALVIGDKKRWWAYKARAKALPANYRAAIDGFERYLMFNGPGDGDSAASLFENLADFFEQSAADGKPVREVVGDDPVEFIEAFIRNYPEGDWRNKERQRLIDTIDRVADNEA